MIQLREGKKRLLDWINRLNMDNFKNSLNAPSLTPRRCATSGIYNVRNSSACVCVCVTNSFAYFCLKQMQAEQLVVCVW